MNAEEFFKIYLPALEKALENDDKNCGFYVEGPDDFIDPKYQQAIDIFIEESIKYSFFLHKIEYYFDAKSHYFPEVDGINIDEYRRKIISDMLMLKKDFEIYACR